MMLGGGRDFQSFAGPGDRGLSNSEISGYQPVSRIGETVVNAFVDAYEWGNCKSLTMGAFSGNGDANPAIYEKEPMFHAWATVQPGMVCLSRKNKTSIFRQYTAAETACPVIACAAGLSKNQEIDFFFAGIARSKSVRSPSDGQGETVDEFFTLSIGGMVTLLNNSGAVISPGDQVEWCFTPGPGKGNTRPSGDPRRVGVKVCSPNSPRAIGRALSFSKNGETFDLLLSGN
jgi:hypothetical protein